MFGRKRCLKTLSAVAAILLMMSVLAVSVCAATEFDTYTYSNTGEVVFSPDIYSASRVITGASAGVGSMAAPVDVAVGDDGRVYIADTANDRIVIFNSECTAALSMSKFRLPDGAITTLREPQGICVDKNGVIYICDTGNNRVLSVSSDGTVLKEMGKPDSQYFTEGIEFIPKKISVDSTGVLYVSAVGAYQGLTLFAPTGEFIGFYGAEEVEATSEVIGDYLWKQFMTAEQRDAMASYVPPEACNIYVSNNDFVLTIANSYFIPNTSEKNKMDNIRILNPKGVSTIKINTSENPGNAIATDAKYLNFVAGCIDSNGFITLADNSKNRILQFDKAMNLIGIFGGSGNEAGKFSAISDIDVYNGKLYVLDSASGCITIFDETKYGTLIQEALVVYNTSEQSAAIPLWRSVLEYNTNYDLAYVGIGRALLNEGNAKEAMNYFKLGNSSLLYSDAFSVYRTDVVRSYGYFVILAFLIICAVILVLKRRMPVISLEQIKNSKTRLLFYTFRHPFDGFEYAKAKKKLSMPLSFACIALYAFLNLFQIQFTGKQFKMVGLNDINLLWQIIGAVAVVLIWVIANWCFSVLIEGKATMKQIWVFTAYSLMPYVFCSYIKVILTNFLIREESFFASCVVIIGVLWSLVMIVAAFSRIQEFEGTQSIKAIMLTLFGMAIIAILIFVIYMLAQQLISTVLQLSNEILFGIRNGWR